MLFGHQDNTVDQTQQNTPAPVVADHSMQQPVDQSVAVNPLAVDSATGISLPVVTPDAPSSVDTPAVDAPDESTEQSVLNQPSAPNLDNAPTVTDDASTLPDPGTPFGASPVAADVNPTEVQEAAVIASELDAAPAEAEVQAPALAQDTYPAPQPEPQQHADSTADTYAAAPMDTTPVDNAIAPHTDDLLQLKQQVITQLSPLISHLDQSSEEKFRTTMMLIQSTDNSALLKDAYDAARAIADDGARAQALLDVVNEINYFTQQRDAQGN